MYKRKRGILNKIVNNIRENVNCKPKTFVFTLNKPFGNTIVTHIA